MLEGFFAVIRTTYSVCGLGVTAIDLASLSGTSSGSEETATGELYKKSINAT